MAIYYKIQEKITRDTLTNIRFLTRCDDGAKPSMITQCLSMSLSVMLPIYFLLSYVGGQFMAWPSSRVSQRSRKCRPGSGIQGETGGLMANQFWIRGSKGVLGPFDQLQVRGLVAIGELTLTMEISTDSVSWQPAGKVRGLFPKVEMPAGSATARPTATAPPSGSSETTKVGAPRVKGSASSTSAWKRIGFAAIGFAALCVGGWDIAWGQNFYGWDGQRAFVYLEDIYLGHGVAIAVNGSYYGMAFSARFFDAPFISWVCFFCGFGSLGRALG